MEETGDTTEETGDKTALLTALVHKHIKKCSVSRDV